MVQHDDLLNRVVPGVDRYQISGDLTLAPGDSVDLWTDGAKVQAARVDGKDPLPAGSLPGGHALKGVVVNVDKSRVMIEHEAIPDVMGAMVMGFGVAPWEAAPLRTGLRIEGRLQASGFGWQLVDIEVVGEANGALRTDVAPLSPGEQLPAVQLVGEDGQPLVVGAGQGVPTALTFIYTRCPDPSFCPAIAARMAGLQGFLKGARIVTVTLDPENDTPAALKAWGTAMGADLEKWRLARAEPLALQELALRGGQHVTVDGGKISHLHRLLILDAEGRLIERYDDNNWPTDRVVEQLSR